MSCAGSRVARHDRAVDVATSEAAIGVKTVLVVKGSDAEGPET